MATEFLITSSLEPIKKGQEFEGSLPLHVTLLQWFTVDSQPAFQNALQNLTMRTPGFEVVTGEEALYGPNNDVPVRLLRGFGKLARLHADVVELVARYGGEMRNPEWAGERYSPHVTHVGERTLQPDEIVPIRALELIKRHDGERSKRVEVILPLRNGR